MQVYYDKDADLSASRANQLPLSVTVRKATLMRANLKESGVNVVIGLRQGGS